MHVLTVKDRRTTVSLGFTGRAREEEGEERELTWEMTPGLTIGSSRVRTSVLWFRMKNACALRGSTSRRRRSMLRAVEATGDVEEAILRKKKVGVGRAWKGRDFTTLKKGSSCRRGTRGGIEQAGEGGEGRRVNQKREQPERKR